MAESDRPQIVLVNRSLVRNDAGEILLVQRAENDQHYPGKWELPGGKQDSGQDLTDALKREVMEETGLQVEPESNLVFAESYVIETGRYKGLSYVALFGVARVVGGMLRLSHEHDDSAWAPYDRALEYDLTPPSRNAIVALGDLAFKSAAMA